MDMGDSGLGAVPLTVGGLGALVGSFFGVAKFLGWLEVKMEAKTKAAIEPVAARIAWLEANMEAKTKGAVDNLTAQIQTTTFEITRLKAQATIDRDALQKSEKEALLMFVRAEDLRRLEENIAHRFDDLKRDIRHLSERSDHTPGHSRGKGDSD